MARFRSNGSGGKHDVPPPPKRKRFLKRVVEADSEEDKLTRRSFTKWTLGGVTALVAAAIAGPAAAYVAAPMFREKEDSWRAIGRIDKAEAGEPDLAQVGKPALTSFREVVQDAYFEPAPQNTSVYVVNEGDGEFTVFDVRCSHLGCPITYDEDREEYVCPCHTAIFDMEGRVTGGPPPRPLDRYEVKIEENVLYAGKLYQVNNELERTTS